MSDVNHTDSGGGAALTMNDQTRSDLYSRADYFSGLLNSGASQDQIRSGSSSLISGANTALENYYNNNSSGLDQNSYKSLQNADTALGGLRGEQLNGSNVTDQMKTLVNQIKSELKPQQPTTPPAATPPATQPNQGAGGDTAQIVQLLQQIVDLLGKQGADPNGQSKAAATPDPAKPQQQTGDAGKPGDAGNQGANGDMGKLTDQLKQLITQLGASNPASPPANNPPASNPSTPDPANPANPAGAPATKAASGGAGSGNMQQLLVQLLQMIMTMLQQQMGGGMNGGSGSDTPQTS